MENENDNEKNDEVNQEVTRSSISLSPAKEEGSMKRSQHDSFLMLMEEEKEEEERIIQCHPAFSFEINNHDDDEGENGNEYDNSDDYY